MAKDTTPKHKDVHAAILAVMGQVRYVQKQKAQGLNYTFAGEAALIGVLHPEMVAAGLTCVPIDSELLESTAYDTRNGGKMRLVRTRQTFRFSHPDSGTFVDVKVLGEGADAGDKSVPKSLTIGFKYALRQTFIIETGDDPDEHASVPEAPPPPPPRKLTNSQGGVRRAVNEFDQRTAANLPEPEANPWGHQFEGTPAYPGKFRGIRLADMPEGTVRKLLQNIPWLSDADISNLNAAWERPELQIKITTPKEAA